MSSKKSAILLSILVLCANACVWQAAAKSHAKPVAKKDADDFPLTNLKLATKPVSRWAYGFYPLSARDLVADPVGYLHELEQNMSRRDELKGLKVEDDKRFADTLQFCIQEMLAAAARNKAFEKPLKAEAVKLEHRLARIQSKHPEFCPEDHNSKVVHDHRASVKADK